MSNVNKVILIGRLGKDPEVRYMQDGNPVTNLTLATSKQWKNKQGEPQERTEWHRIASYRKLAEIMGKYLKKGSLVYIEGELQTRKWQDGQGNDRYTTEVLASSMQMLGGKPNNRMNEDGTAKSPQQVQQEANQKTQEQKMPEPDFDFDDDIPF